MYTFELSGTDDQVKVALVRNEIDDVSGSEAGDGGTAGKDYFLSDERILAFLAAAADEAPSDATATEVRLFACGAAEGALAKNQAFVLKAAKTLGREDDGPAVGAEIRKHAEGLIARAWASIRDRRALAEVAAADAAAGFMEPLGGNIDLCAVG